MALKRSDLTKRFDEIVKAEIANHNEAICQSNIALAEVVKSIKILESRIDEKFKVEANRFLDLTDLLSEKLKLLNDRAERLTQENLELRNLLSKSLNALDSSIIASVESCAKHSDISMIKKELEALIAKERLLIDSNSTQSKKSLAAFFSEFNNRFGVQRSEYFSLKEEVEQRFKKSEESIELEKMDVESVSKEIRVLKKSLFIQDKNIENLYTLIDKLKKKPTEKV